MSSRKPTRQQLARICAGDQELIRAFEALFDLAASDTTEIPAIQLALAVLTTRIGQQEVLLEETAIESGTATAVGTSALDQLVRIADSLDFLALAPPVTHENRLDASGFKWKVRTVTAAADVYVGDWCEADATSSAFTVTLPDVAASIGKMLIVTKTDASANIVTVAGTINGATNLDLTLQYTAITLASNGTEWRII